MNIPRVHRTPPTYGLDFGEISNGNPEDGCVYLKCKVTFKRLSRSVALFNCIVFQSLLCVKSYIIMRVLLHILNLDFDCVESLHCSKFDSNFIFYIYF